MKEEVEPSSRLCSCIPVSHPGRCLSSHSLFIPLILCGSQVGGNLSQSLLPLDERCTLDRPPVRHVHTSNLQSPSLLSVGGSNPEPCCEWTVLTNITCAYAHLNLFRMSIHWSEPLVWSWEMFAECAIRTECGSNPGGLLHHWSCGLSPWDHMRVCRVCVFDLLWTYSKTYSQLQMLSTF